MPADPTDPGDHRGYVTTIAATLMAPHEKPAYWQVVCTCGWASAWTTEGEASVRCALRRHIAEVTTEGDGSRSG